VIDANDDVAGRFRAIDAELVAYGAELAERPQIVVLNKIDVVPQPPWFGVDDSRVLAVIPTSAVTGEGVDELRRALFDLVPESPPELSRNDELADFLVYRPEPDRRRPFRIFKTERGYRVQGDAPDEALQAAGVRPEDVIERV
jgi:50S ribosomal subunit-associated GTPase HflX